jgi:hypothetical protein
MEINTSHVVRTLVGSGFQVKNVVRKPSCLVFHATRRDEFGVEATYLLALVGEAKLSTAEVNGLKKTASYQSASLIIIGETVDPDIEGVVIVTYSDFMQKLGGAISSYLPLETTYGQQLNILGQNSLPDGLVGIADDLFEEYVRVGLQFLLGNRVIRYGQDRRFEALPDGVAFASEQLILLYDCKAAAEGYDVNRNTIRQFSDYVETFHRRYERYIGRVHAFLVISGNFQSEDTLDDRSRDLLAECHVPLAFLTAEHMGEVVKMLVERPTYRQSLDWKRIFSGGKVLPANVRKNLRARTKDKIIRA